MQEPMMKVEEVAELLNVKASMVYRLKDQPNGLKAYKVGRCVRFKRGDVEAYLAGHAVEPVICQKPCHGARFKYVPGMKVV